MQAELIDFCEAKGDSADNRLIAAQERQRCMEMGVEINRIYELDELVGEIRSSSARRVLRAAIL